MMGPPVNDDPKKYFKLASESPLLCFRELSMGMSADLIEAIHFNSTIIRIGSIFFGNRF